MATDRELDGRISSGTNGFRRQETASLMHDPGVQTFQNAISMEIISLVRTRLQDARMKGIVTAEISDRLLHRYIADLKQMENGTSRKQLLERLRILEKRQEELVHVYYESLRRLQTEIRRYRRVAPSNEGVIHENEVQTSRTPRTMLEPEPARFDPSARPRRARERSIQQIVFSYLCKYLLPVAIIGTLTIVGIRFGMTPFIATGSLLIGASLLFRFFKR